MNAATQAPAALAPATKIADIRAIVEVCKDFTKGYGGTLTVLRAEDGTMFKTFTQCGIRPDHVGQAVTIVSAKVKKTETYQGAEQVILTHTKVERDAFFGPDYDPKQTAFVDIDGERIGWLGPAAKNVTFAEGDLPRVEGLTGGMSLEDLAIIGSEAKGFCIVARAIGLWSDIMTFDDYRFYKTFAKREDAETVLAVMKSHTWEQARGWVRIVHGALLTVDPSLWTKFHGEMGDGYNGFHRPEVDPHLTLA